MCFPPQKKCKIFLVIKMTSSACNHYVDHTHLVNLYQEEDFMVKKDTDVGDKKS